MDGIVFHQILQLHGILSGKFPRDSVVNLEINMFWYSLFHAMAWTITAIGLFLLFRAGHRAEVPWSGKALFGAMLLGWGAFNFIEGIIDHHILDLHHVVQQHGRSIFDYLFLASGLVFIGGGVMVIRSARQSYPPRVSD